jgi:signal peptidase I
LPDPGIFPPKSLKKQNWHVFRYTGSSMQPTFKPGQLLYVRPDVEDIKPGDVLVYKQKERYIVHRVLDLDNDTFITRGDNNARADRNPVQRQQVVGRVEINEDKSRASTVKRGSLGLWQALFISLSKIAIPSLRLVIGWPYRVVKRTNILPRLWRPKIMRLRLQSGGGVIVKYIHNQKTVATWDMSKGTFGCKRPFDLVICDPLDEGKNAVLV